MTDNRNNFNNKINRRYNEIDPEKKAMYKKLYLAGTSVAQIGKALGAGIGARTVYHHLQPLTPDEIAIHNKNSYIRRRAARQEKKQQEVAKKEGD